MAGLQEQARWENEIYRIEENDPVHGGENGITNKPTKQLANRTKYLKKEVEKQASTTQVGRVQLVDNLTTADNTKALTAGQGKILQDSKMDGMVKTVINLNHLSSEVWYPVVFSGIGVKHDTARFSVRNYFQGKPRWASHSDGFSMHVDWLSNASSWGGFSVVRVISRCDFLFTAENKSPILKIGQIHESSEEYCYLRGGATYEVWHEPYVRAAYHSSTYTWRSSAGDYTFSLPLITSYEANLVPKANLDVLKALIDSKVSKSGDVVAGDLTINGYLKTLNNYVAVTATDTRFAGLDIIRTGSQGSWLSRMEALPDKRWKFWTENGHNIFLPAASGTVPLSHEVVSKAGDTMTGQLLINHDTSNVKGLRSNVLKWFVGLNASNSDDVLLHSFGYNNTLTLKSDRTESNKPLYVGENKVLTTVDLADTLTTNDNTKALTAAQGKALQDSKMDGMVKTVIDMTPYYLNFWYPVIFSGMTQVGSQTARFAVRSQYQSKPAWSTHDLGFTLNLNWTSNASNWGGNEVTRVIERFDYRFTNENKSPVLKVGQIHESSEEYCYLRAGAIYEVWHEPYVTVAVHSTGYTWRDGSGHFSNTLRALTRYDSTLVPKTNLTVLRELADSKVSKAGDTMTGELVINHNISHIKGQRNGSDKWSVGLKDGSSNDVVLHSYTGGNEIVLGETITSIRKPLYIAGIKALTGSDVINNLTTHITSAPLSAAQGKKLNDTKADKATTLAGYGIENFATGSLTTQNLNELTTTGIYGQATSDNATRERSYPEKEAGSIQVLPSAYGRMQIYTTFNSKKMYARNTAWNGGWDDWKRIDGADWSEVRDKPTTIDGYSTTSNQPLAINHNLAHITGQRNGANKWSIGLRNGTDDDVVIHSYAHNNEFILKSNRTESNKPLYVGENKVLTEADLSNGLTGAVMYFAMTSPPDGWLKADGRAVSRTTYAALFTRIGTTFGAGDGRTTFNLPDLRGEFIRGWDNGRNVDSGRTLGSFQFASMQPLTSSGSEYLTGITNKDNNSSQIWSRAQHDKITQGSRGYQDVKVSYMSSFSWHGRNQVGLVNNGNNAVEFGAVRPRNVALLACIKY